MNSSELLLEIIDRFKEKGFSQVPGYNKFGYIKDNHSSVIVSREKGKNTSISFSKIIIGINGYISDIELYDKGPSALRGIGITHVNSPIYSLLHLLEKKDYKL